MAAAAEHSAVDFGAIREYYAKAQQELELPWRIRSFLIAGFVAYIFGGAAMAMGANWLTRTVVMLPVYAVSWVVDRLLMHKYINQDFRNAAGALQNRAFAEHLSRNTVLIPAEPQSAEGARALNDVYAFFCIHKQP